MIADSRSSVGARPLASIWARSGESFQSSLPVMSAPLPACNSRVGSAIRPGTGLPPELIEGPFARSRTRFTSLPLTMNPPIRLLSPVSTRARVEMFSNCAGVGVGVAVGVAVGEAVAVAVAVGVAVAVAVAVGVGLVLAGIGNGQT